MRRKTLINKEKWSSRRGNRGKAKKSRAFTGLTHGLTKKGRKKGSYGRKACAGGGGHTKQQKRTKTNV